MTVQPSAAVIVDSTASLPPALLDGLPLHVVPLRVELDGATYLDGVEISAEELYRRLPLLKCQPKSSAPSPASFLDAFRLASGYTQDLLCITLTATLSGTYDAARVAAETALEALPGVRIRVLDSSTVGGAEGLVALAAARAAGDGRPPSEVVSIAQGVAERVHFLGVMETLHYAWSGGHIPRAALWATRLLDIKPVLDIWRGEVRLLARPRTKANGVLRMLSEMAGRVRGGPLHVMAMHADARDQAEGPLAQIEARFPCRDTLIVPFTPVIGAHTGPGLLAVAFYED